MPFMATARLQLGTTCLLVVDLQEKLVPAMNDSEHLVQQVGRLIDGVSVLEVPAIDVMDRSLLRLSWFWPDECPCGRV